MAKPLVAEADGNRTRLSRVAAHTGFEDSNSSANVGIDSKAAGQGMIPPNIGENLTLLNNGSNGDSVPATVPGSELVRPTRQQLNLEPLPCQQNPGNRGASLDIHEESDKVIKRHPTPLLTCDDACASSTNAITKRCGPSPPSSQVSRLVGPVRGISRLVPGVSTPAALAVGVVGSVRALRGPDGVDATSTRPARSLA